MTNRIINYTAFAILTVLWLAFAAALIFNRPALGAAWQTFWAWPFLVKLLVGLLTLPVAAGLWVWNTTWPLLLRLALVLGLALMTIYTFFPKKNGDQPEPGAKAP